MCRIMSPRESPHHGASVKRRGRTFWKKCFGRYQSFQYLDQWKNIPTIEAQQEIHNINSNARRRTAIPKRQSFTVVFSPRETNSLPFHHHDFGLRRAFTSSFPWQHHLVHTNLQGLTLSIVVNVKMEMVGTEETPNTPCTSTTTTRYVLTKNNASKPAQNSSHAPISGPTQ